MSQIANCCDCNYEEFCATSGPSCDDAQVSKLDLELLENQDADFPTKDKHRAQTRKKGFQKRNMKPIVSHKTETASLYGKKEKSSDIKEKLADEYQLKEYLG